jgi:hypothetical protein
MALAWKEGEGYDIHVLRGGQASKALDSTIDVDPQLLAQFPLAFIPHFKGAPNSSALGVQVNPATGAVTAKAHPAAPNPKFPNFNFLMTVRQNSGQGNIVETLIRIHIHDTVKKFWLTPPTLTIHTHSDECRFTVLAQFDDDVVGDITDWTKITIKSADNNIVDVLADGILSAQPGRPDTDMDVPITATLDLPTNLTAAGFNKTVKAKAVTRMNWTSLARDHSPMEFVDGPVRPDPEEPTGSHPDSVKAVVSARTNVLFISEGFPQSQQTDFKQAVETLVKTGLRNPVLEPFTLLKDSINYWSLFLPSQEDPINHLGGVSLLGDIEIKGTSPNQTAAEVVPRPEEPLPSSQSWSVANMIHQIGLPAPRDPVRSIPDWIKHWNKIYDTVTPLTESLIKPNFADWELLRQRSTLNERDSLFGFAKGVRARVSELTGGDALLRPAPRRTSEASIEKFIEQLSFGSGFPGGSPFNIGAVWSRTATDQGLVCFVCLSDVRAGEARTVFFAATTGADRVARLTTGTDGLDIKTPALSDPTSAHASDMFASLVAHEFGHGLGLGDEYGPGDGTLFTLGSSAIPIFPNLQTKFAITSTTGSTTSYDPDKIKWLFPRTIKVGRIDQAPVSQGGGKFQMKMEPGHAKPFAKGDLVLMRRPPLRGSDPFAEMQFVVGKPPSGDVVDVTQKSGPALNANLFDPSFLHVLICASLPSSPGVELKLIAERILKHIRTSSGPLTGAACTAVNNGALVMTPTNLPTSPKLKFKKNPATMADVIGIYEGGGHFDCGVFRPAGRCKMRTAEDRLMPFCHVCRYLIVDRIDPMKFADLDKMYDPFYPT